ncbi:hypothetical protein I5748_016885 [Clostridioides difficile]
MSILIMDVLLSVALYALACVRPQSRTAAVFLMRFTSSRNSRPDRDYLIAALFLLACSAVTVACYCYIRNFNPPCWITILVGIYSLSFSGCFLPMIDNPGCLSNRFAFIRNTSSCGKNRYLPVERAARLGAVPLICYLSFFLSYLKPFDGFIKQHPERAMPLCDHASPKKAKPEVQSALWRIVKKRRR